MTENEKSNFQNLTIFLVKILWSKQTLQFDEKIQLFSPNSIKILDFLALPFPSRRIFGNKSESVSGERQKQLTTYMNCLMLTLAKIESCPLFGQPHKKSVQKLSGFFHESAEEVTEEAKELE